MDPVGPATTRILVLHFNGRALLDECLPSVVAAARASAIPCRVTLVDNGSTDDSLADFARRWPTVELVRRPNRGLASFNDVVAGLDEPVVLLLNDDVKLRPDAVEPLVRRVLGEPDALFAAPQCWTFDGRQYEGMRTRVRLRFGLIRGLCRTPDHERHIDAPGLTAAAGPILAVHRRRFVELGGFDPLYFPGRIEDLDLGFRGWMAGWAGYYEPASVAYHRGFGSFGPAHGADGCDRLALRNSLLFAWKNLSGGRLLSHLAWLPARLLLALVRGRGRLRAHAEAFALAGRALASRRQQRAGGPAWRAREAEFFRRFAW